jgi:sensor histidine kinase YesM
MNPSATRLYFSLAAIFSVAIGLFIHLNSLIDRMANRTPAVPAMQTAEGLADLSGNILITSLVAFSTFALNFFIIRPTERKRRISIKLVFMAVALTLLSVLVLSDIFFALRNVIVSGAFGIWFNPFYVIRDLIISMVILGSLFVIKTINDRREYQLVSERLEKEKILQQFESLKSQISPHFLFNSLAALKLLISDNAVLAQNYLDHLSSVLRDSIQATDQAMVTLKEELDALQSYLFLLRIRYESNLQVDIGADDGHLTDRLPRHALHTLVENAVKHNVISRQHPLHIRIHAGNGRVIVRNNLKEKIAPEPGTGIGLSNLASRYQLLAGADIQIFRTAAEFRVELPLIKPMDHESGHRRR